MTIGNLLCGGLLLGLMLAAGYQEYLALALILLAGIPHGAFDLRWAQSRWPAASPVVIVAAYLAIGASMSVFCLVLPAAGLLAFLGLSVFHFVEGELTHSHRATAVAFGLASIVVPIAFHLEAAGGYLGFFFPAAQFQAAVPSLRVIGQLLFGICLAMVVVDTWQGRRAQITERTLCLAGWVLLPPLAGFAVWFIGRHSRQHLLACRSHFRQSTPGLPRDFIALSILALLLLLPLLLRFDPRDLNQLFAASIILVAGLTLPHIIVTHETIGMGASGPA